MGLKFFFDVFEDLVNLSMLGVIICFGLLHRSSEMNYTKWDKISHKYSLISAIVLAQKSDSPVLMRIIHS